MGSDEELEDGAHAPSHTYGDNFARQSIYRITRELKKEQNSLFSCLCSILYDVQFVNEMKSLYPGVPLLANLRCGLWYTQEPDATCYFKSTDVSAHSGLGEQENLQYGCKQAA
jgi:hypothetical protein